MIKHRNQLGTVVLIVGITILFFGAFVDTSKKLENTKPVFTSEASMVTQTNTDTGTITKKSPTFESDKMTEDKLSTGDTSNNSNDVKKDNKTRNHDSKENKTVTETSASDASNKKMMGKTTESSQKQSNDKLAQTESTNNSISSNIYNGILNSNVDNVHQNNESNTSVNRDDHNEYNKGKINERKTLNSNASGTVSAAPSTSAAAAVATNVKDDEQLPAPPLLNWDYIVNDAYDDDELYGRTFVELYDIGVEAYLENNWRDCITYLETAVHEFRVYRHALINCRVQCTFELERTEPYFDSNIEQMQFYDLITRRALCLGKCHNKLLRKQYLPPFYLHRSYRERFINKKPYEYLQLCYYKVS